VEIAQIRQVDMVQEDKWLVQPSLQLCSIIAENRQVGKRLPQLAKSCYTFEASNHAEPSRLIKVCHLNRAGEGAGFWC
jgi:hypothetical protein